MKKLTSLLLSASLLLFISSCGGGNDDDPIVEPTGQTTWQFEEYEYIGGVGLAETTSTFGVITITTEEDTSNGAFSGSALGFTHTLQGQGRYKVVSSSEFAEERTEDPTAKIITLTCTVGSATPDATLYEGISGEISVSIDNKGLYHLDAPSIVLSYTGIDSGEGIPDSPSRANLKIVNAFGFGFGS